MTGLRITPLKPDALDDLADALAAAKLPVADLGEPGRRFFRFDDASGLAGFGGIEGDGADCLLRSLVIVPERRGVGLGRAKLALIERVARDVGVQRLHLLTTTAAAFFRAAGFADAERNDAPAVIAASHEFATLCPASGVYLVKTLAEAD